MADGVQVFRLLRAEGFGSLRPVRRGSLDLFDLMGTQPVGSRWSPVEVERVEPESVPLGDFPALDGLPAFSSRALAHLKEQLEPCGEVLPLACRAGRFFVFHLTHVADALDEERSEVVRFASNPRKIMDIRRYVFLPDRLSRCSILKCAGAPRAFVFVTSRFVESVVSAGLQGFRFLPVWPDVPAGRADPLVATLESSSVTEPGVANPRIREVSRPESEVASGIRELANDAAAALGGASGQDPRRIVERIHAHIGKLSANRVSSSSDTPVALGALWGEQVRRAVGWSWIQVSVEGSRDEEGMLGLASPDRAYLVLPSLVVSKAIAQSRHNTTLLLFEMISEGGLPSSSQGALRLLE